MMTGVAGRCGAGRGWRGVVEEIRQGPPLMIELERQEKRIRSSLEAHVIINVNNKNIFQVIESVDFSEICITSDLEINLCKGILKEDSSLEHSVTIKVMQAKGEKCDRCWKYSLSCENFAGRLVCPRCSSVLDPKNL